MSGIFDVVDCNKLYAYEVIMKTPTGAHDVKTRFTGVHDAINNVCNCKQELNNLKGL